MSTTATAPEPTVTEHAFRPYRLTVDRYERMVEAGIFNEKDPVFLWHGTLVEKRAKEPLHCNALTHLHYLMLGLELVGWHARQGQPIAIGHDSMPEPDLTVVRGVPRDYLEHHPAVRDVALIVEVADSSLPIDSGTVLKTYAEASVPIYWIVNLLQRQIEVYTQPTGSAYGSQQIFGPEGFVPVVLGRVQFGRIAVRDILP